MDNIIEKIDAITSKQDEKMGEIEKKGAELETKNGELVTQNETLTKKAEQLETRLLEVEQKAALPTQAGGSVEQKSLGQLITDSDKFALLKSGVTDKVSIEIKAPTGDVGNAAAATYSQRLAGIVEIPQSQPTIYQFLPRGRATSNAIDYIKEVVFVSNADEVAEFGTLPLSTTEFVEVQTPVATVGHYIKSSDQMMADNTAVADLIDSRIGSKVLQKMDNLIVTGTGTIKGLIDVSNHTVLAGVEGDGIYHAIRRAITALEVGEFSASVVLLNPADVEMLDLDSLSDGAFRAANARGYNAPTVWGLPVVTSHHVTAGKFFVLDSSYVQVWERAGVTVEMGYDADDFTHNRKTIRGNMRAALTVFNAGAVQYGDVTTAVAPLGAAKAKAK